MGVPALLVEFPAATGAEGTTPGPAVVARAGLLGRQWPVFWLVGNRFFRPISTLGIVGYGSAAVACFLARGATMTASMAMATAGRNSSSSNSIITVRGDWRVYALAAVCHLVTVVHSAVNMQPVNEKIEALGILGVAEEEEEEELDGSKNNSSSSSSRRRHDKAALRPELAETYARTWIRYNTVRLITPVVAGTLALTQILGTGVTATTTLPVPVVY